jgi:hypothetical protein
MRLQERRWRLSRRLAAWRSFAGASPGQPPRQAPTWFLEPPGALPGLKFSFAKSREMNTNHRGFAMDHTTWKTFLPKAGHGHVYGDQDSEYLDTP